MTAPSDVRTCYRHPDRVSGISCQRCDRPICPQCMHQASVGFHCPECAKAGKQKVYQGAGSWLTKPIVSPVLIGINVVVFVLQLATRTATPFTDGGKLIFDEVGLYGDLSLFGPLVPAEPYRLVTSGFLHSYELPFGLIHIAMNMYALYIFGVILEPIIGRLRFAALYTASLLGGSLGVVLLDPRAATAGASGAIFGLMGGAIVMARERGIDLMRSGLVTTLAINLFITFGVPGISIGGHIGGLLAGGAAGLILIEGSKRMGPKGDAISSALAVGLGIVLGIIAVSLMSSEYGNILG
ncbi:MAG TPA: rhomboid family intramembrane serine protease [Iamia sp.]|nr:rhomboid family intramembrane serine protease [Iamia sp.]